MEALQYVLYIAVIISILCSVYYSSRRRRATTPKTSGIYTARMNISMGLMLLFIALIQILLFEESTVRIIVGSLFILVGLFNLFAGLRNHAIYAHLDEKK